MNWDDEFLKPACAVVPIAKDGKQPAHPYGGFHKEDGPKQDGWQVNADNEGVVVVGPDGRDPHDLVETLEETGYGAGLVDVRDKYLGVFDIDVVDDPSEADREKGKWADLEAAWDFAAEIHDGTKWSSQSGAPHVPFLLTEEAYEALFHNEYTNGWGVESIKGAAGKGYVKSPFSPDYGVESSGGVPIFGLDDLEELDFFEKNETVNARATNPEDYEKKTDLGRDELLSIEETTDMDVVTDALNSLRHGDFDLMSRETNVRGDGTVELDPSWRQSTTGSSLQWVPDGYYYDHKKGIGLPAEKVVALEEGVIASSTDHLAGDDWRKAVRLTRRRGADVPRHVSGSPSLVKMGRTQDVTEHDRARLKHIKNVLDDKALSPIEADHEGEFPMRVGKSGKYAEGACPEDRRMIITPNTLSSRDSHRKYGPEDQIETMPSTESWLAQHPVYGDEFRAYVASGFLAARAKSHMLQKYDDLEAPDEEPYFEQYEEDPTASLVLSSPGMDAVDHWTEHVDTIVYDDNHPLREHVDAFRLDSTQWENGVRGAIDELVRALPVGPRSLDELLENGPALGRVINQISRVTRPSPDDRDDVCLLEISRRSDVTMETWRRLMVVIEQETGMRATDADATVLGRAPDGQYVWFRDPQIPESTNIVITSGDTPPVLTDVFFDLIGREPPERVNFTESTLRGYWRAHKHNVHVVRDLENTRSGGNVNADFSEQMLEMAAATAPEAGGRDVAEVDSLKGFEARGVSRDEVRRDPSKMHFADVRGNPEFDDRRTLVVQGSSFFPGFVETMMTAAGETVELVQEGSDPLEARNAETGEVHERAQSLLLWMKQADVTQAAARVGSATDEESHVFCATRHIGPQFDSYDVTDNVALLTEAERETLDAVRSGREHRDAVGDEREVTPQAAGEILNRLVARGILEKREYAGDNGEHRYEGSDIDNIFIEPSDPPSQYRAPLADHSNHAWSDAEIPDPTEQTKLPGAPYVRAPPN